MLCGLFYVAGHYDGLRIIVAILMLWHVSFLKTKDFFQVLNSQEHIQT